VLLRKIPAADSLTWDFTNCPDLAQTVAVCCAMKNIHLTLTGLESLKIMETDRVFALQEELAKLGAELNEVEKNLKYEVVRKSDWTAASVPSIFTYDDHRMALAFAPVGMMQDIIIEEPGVVVKSYPGYWNDLAKVTTWEEMQLS